MFEKSIPLAQLADSTARQFAARFGRPARWIIAAPGRVNIIGEHTDYNDGFVLPMAIDRYTIIGADFAPSGHEVRWHCTQRNVTATFDLGRPVKKGEPRWSDYVRGVFARFQEMQMVPPGLDVVMDYTVPLGGGLSSSASLEVAAATLIEKALGKAIDPVEKALVCQWAEHHYAGVPCGIMDQFTSVLGRQDHLILLDCRSRQTELVPLRDPSVEVLIINTNVKHELTGGGYAKRRQQCEEAARTLGVKALRDATQAMLDTAQTRLDPVVYRRARHVIGEIGRTTRAASEIRAGNWPKVGELMYASHASLRDDYEVSCAELDVVVETARDLGSSRGVIGCRMTGGGFGGCAVALVRSETVPTVASAIAATYEHRTKLKPTIFVSRPGPGVTVVQG